MIDERLLKEKSFQAIVSINDLIIPEKKIANTIYHSVKLSQGEKNHWNSFSNSEKHYLLTGDSQIMLDFT